MTLKRAIQSARELRDTEITDETMTEWLNAHDESLWRRALQFHGVAQPEQYVLQEEDEEETENESSEDTTEDVVLMLPDRYAVELYPLFLCSRIDLAHGDYTRFNNNMLLYNDLLQKMLNDYTRERAYQSAQSGGEHKPLAMMF